jgi:hypothetical protein
VFRFAELSCLKVQMPEIVGNRVAKCASYGRKLLGLTEMLLG